MATGSRTRSLSRDRDNVVRLADQQKTIKLLEEGGASIKFTVYPGVGHDSWTRTYNNPDFYKWLLSQKRNHKEDGNSE